MIIFGLMAGAMAFGGASVFLRQKAREHDDRALGTAGFVFSLATGLLVYLALLMTIFVEAVP